MHLFNVLNTVNLMLFISWIIGSSFLPEKIPWFTLVFQLYIASVLVYKYNPYTPPRFTSIDQQIIFTAALTIITTSVTNIYHDRWIRSLIK